MEIGVNVELDVREYGVWRSLRGARDYTGMIDHNFSTVAPYLIPSSGLIEPRRMRKTRKS